MSRSTRWRWLLRLLFAAFLLGVGFLLYRQARTIEWAEVGQTLLAADRSTLAAALGLTVVSYLSYASLDLIARRYVGHAVPPLRVLAVGATVFAFNLNIGAAVGSAGLRLRLYSRMGVRPADIARIIALAVSGNWSGYVLLGGLLLSLQQIELPPQWQPGSGLLRGIGVAMLAAFVAYPLLCAFSPLRQWTLRGHVIELPTLDIALLQIGASLLNWLAVATTIWILLPPLPFADVLGAVLLSAVAGAIAHIPAGLGVLETVFVMLLSDQIATARIIAALVAFRGVYYLLPLLFAIGSYFTLEHGARDVQENKGPDGTPGPMPS